MVFYVDNSQLGGEDQLAIENVPILTTERTGVENRALIPYEFNQLRTYVQEVKPVVHVNFNKT